MIREYLEHTDLNESATWKNIRNSIKVANENKVLGFCTYLHWSGIVDKYLDKTVKKVYVIGFNIGAVDRLEKDLDMLPYAPGDEYDVVLPLTPFTVGDITRTKTALEVVRKATKDKILKVIIETTVLRDCKDAEDKIKSACKIVEDIGGDFVKTNTGKFLPRKVDIVEDIKLIKRYTKLPIKAAGGIKTFEEAKKLIDLGVKRIGTSSADKIVGEENGRK